MQFSIGKLATILVALLITVTVVTTASGLLILRQNFLTLEDRRETDAHDTVRNAAIAIRNQIRFYQDMLQIMSANPDVFDLLEFGEVPQIMAWSQTIRRLLPGSLGTALTSTDGVVLGDAPALQVGAACQADVRQLRLGEPISYPPIHTDVPGLEHFDLLATVASPTRGDAGTLFVSFRLSVLADLLAGMTRDGDRFTLLTGDGMERLRVGDTGSEQGLAHYRSRIPDTSWELELTRAQPSSASYLRDLLITDVAVILAVAIVMVGVVRATHGRFVRDMAHVHDALEDVLEDRYEPVARRAAIKEVDVLLADIEQLAAKIQNQRNELRHQSLSDPLTGLFNRRYFDLMLAHLHEQSRRQVPATLVLIDLNDFKHVNDALGHAAGDQVLRHTADYLRSRVRSTDIVARLGGDEFALTLNGMASDTLDDWLAALAHDYDHQVLEGTEPPPQICRFSIGAAPIDARLYASPADVLKAADDAMYSVKERRRVGHSRYAVARSDNVTPINLDAAPAFREPA